jgi:hypothetical protein
VRVVLHVTAPDAGGAVVHVTGSFQGWVASATPMTRDGGGWSHVFFAPEGERVDYKYTLGSWDRVEKGPDRAEIPARVLVVAAGRDGTQTVDDRVLFWRTAGACEDHGAGSAR